MKKFLILSTVILLFICGIFNTNNSADNCLQNSTTHVQSNNVYKNFDYNGDKFFISSNIQPPIEFIFENFGSSKNENFNIKTFFSTKARHLSIAQNKNIYEISFSSIPRAP